MHRGGRFELAEAKWSATPAPRDAANLLHLARVVGPQRVLSLEIICRAESGHPVVGGDDVPGVRVRAVPLE